MNHSIHIPSYAVEAINMWKRWSRYAVRTGIAYGALAAGLLIAYCVSLHDSWFQGFCLSSVGWWASWAFAALFRCNAAELLNAALILKLEQTQTEWRPSGNKGRKNRFGWMSLN